MPKLKMLVTRPGSNDGIYAHLYQAGRTYECSAALADVFFRAGLAEPVPDDAAAETPKPLTTDDERRFARCEI